LWHLEKLKNPMCQSKTAVADLVISVEDRVVNEMHR